MPKKSLIFVMNIVAVPGSNGFTDKYCTYVGTPDNEEHLSNILKAWILPKGKKGVVEINATSEELKTQFPKGTISCKVLIELDDVKILMVNEESDLELIQGDIRDINSRLQH